MIEDNIAAIHKNILVSARRAGRDKEHIHLIAVTKNVSPDAVNTCINSGITAVGESRVQEALLKAPHISGNVQWHLLGHLQTNKVKKAVEFFDMIQSLDGMKLAEAINRHADACGTIQDCLVEVNIAGEKTKHGFEPENVEDFIAHAPDWPHLKIKGIMTIVPYEDDPELTRPCFRRMRKLFESLKRSRIPRADMSILSMGMSHDFPIAVEEGSTMVRIGTAIFGERIS